MRFPPGSTFLLSGPTNAGKTRFLFDLLSDIDKLFVDPRCKQNIIFHYVVWQGAYSDRQNNQLITKWLNEVPTVESVTENCIAFKDSGGSILILDDMSEKIDDEIVHMYKVLSHHLNIHCFTLSQGLFSKNVHFRQLSTNTFFFFLFKNPRDLLQISNFARQFEPTNSKYVVDSFKEATKEPHSYLMVDMHKATSDVLRLRSNILEREFPMKVWVAKTCSI